MIVRVRQSNWTALLLSNRHWNGKKMNTKRKTDPRRTRSDVARVLRQLVENCNDPSRFLELFYWSEEATLAEFMRGYISLPDDAKYTLHAFLRLAEKDLSSLTISVNSQGELVLSSRAVSSSLVVADAAAQLKSAQHLH